MKRRSILLVAVILIILLSISGVYFYKQLNIYAFRLKGFNLQATPHFDILFLEQDEDQVKAVAKAAEKTYELVGKDFDFFPKDRIPIVIYPDNASLQKAFHWPADEGTQGVYYRGFIYIQAPGAWINDTDNLAEVFFNKGPMVHEYTHLVVDRLTGGRYTRWFTEGVAQYEEKKITGYTLASDFDIDMSHLYPLDDILNRFDELPDVPKAYMQALNLTETLAGKGGVGEIKNTLLRIRDGAWPDDILLSKIGNTVEGKTLLVTNITSGGDRFE